MGPKSVPKTVKNGFVKNPFLDLQKIELELFYGSGESSEPALIWWLGGREQGGGQVTISTTRRTSLSKGTGVGGYLILFSVCASNYIYM